MRAKEPAGLLARNRANAFGIAVEPGGEVGGRLDHQPARAAVQADRMSLVRDPPDDVSRFVGDVVIDEKERRARAGRRQGIEQRRCPIPIRSIIKGQVDRRRSPGLLRHPPERLFRPECLVQEWQWCRVCQRNDGDAERDKNDHVSILAAVHVCDAPISARTAELNCEHG